MVTIILRVGNILIASMDSYEAKISVLNLHGRSASHILHKLHSQWEKYQNIHVTSTIHENARTSFKFTQMPLPLAITHVALNQLQDCSSCLA